MSGSRLRNALHYGCGETEITIEAEYGGAPGRGGGFYNEMGEHRWMHRPFGR